MSKDKRRDIWFEEEEITPEKATEYLTLNTPHNRTVSILKVEKLAQDILDGKWKFSHEALAFDWDGNLLDGQHRLHAVVRSKATVRFVVAHNCDPDTFRVINVGGSRTSDDLFVIMFKKKYGAPPANSKYVSSIATGMLRRTRGTVRVGREEIAEHALKHFKLITEYLPTARRHVSVTNTHVGAAFCNAALYYGNSKIAPLAERFASGVWINASDPLKALYDRLVRSATADNRANKLTITDYYRLAVTAIRAALAGAPRTKLEGSSQDFGEAKIDKRLRAGEKVDGRAFREEPVEVATESGE